MKNVIAVASVSAVLLVCGLSVSATSAQTMIRGNVLPTKVSTPAKATVVAKPVLNSTVAKPAPAPSLSAKPVINSLAPAGGEAYKVGDTVTISWEVSGLTTSNNSLGLAVYRKSTGPTKNVLSKTVGNPVASGKVSSAGSFSWKIATSTPVASDYIVYLSTATGYKQSGSFSIVESAPVATSTPPQAQNKAATDLAETFIGVGIITPAKAQQAREIALGAPANMSLFNLVELYIYMGIVSADKAPAARSAVAPVPNSVGAGPEFSLVGTPSIEKHVGMSTQFGATTTVRATFNVSILAREDDYSFSQPGSFVFSVYRNGVKTPVDGALSYFSVPSVGVVTSGLPSGVAFKVQENNQVKVPVYHTFFLSPGASGIYQVELEKINYMDSDGRAQATVLASSSPNTVWKTLPVTSSVESHSSLASVAFAIEDLVRLVNALR